MSDSLLSSSDGKMMEPYNLAVNGIIDSENKLVMRINPGVYRKAAGSGYPEVYLLPGTYPIGIDLSKANANSSQVLSGQTFYSGDTALKYGTMANNGAWSTSIAPGGSVTIPAGYHNGGGHVSASASSISTSHIAGGNSPGNYGITISDSRIKYVIATGWMNNASPGQAPSITGGNISLAFSYTYGTNSTTAVFSIAITGYPASITMIGDDLNFAFDAIYLL